MFLLKLMLKILPLVFWILLMLSFDAPYLTVLTLLAAAIHELSHIAAAEMLFKKKSAAPYAVLTGFRILPKKSLSYSEELTVAAFGPLANILVCALLIPCSSEYLKTFAAVNFLTALSNLMPIKGYDGYRIIDSFLSMKTKDTMRSQRLLNSISFSFCTVATFLSLYLILKIDEGYWIFAIFFSVVLGEIIKCK